MVKCERCKKEISVKKVKVHKSLSYHVKCLRFHLSDIKNKSLYARRKNAIKNPFSGGKFSPK